MKAKITIFLFAILILRVSSVFAQFNGTAQTDATTSIGATTATFNGTIVLVGTSGGIDPVQFEYKLTSAGWPGTAVSASPSIVETDGTTVTYNVTGLSTETSYDVRVIGVDYDLNSFTTGLQTFVTLASVVVPTVTTTAHSGVTASSANSGGNVTSDGGATVDAKGVIWGTTTPLTWGNKSGSTTDGTGTGAYSSSITGLTSNTLYYYAAYGHNSAGYGLGSESSFTSSTPAVIPTVTTTTASSVTSTGFSSGGNVTNAGGASTERGVVCRVVSGGGTPTYLTNTVRTSDGTSLSPGVFASSVTGLAAGAIYNYRSYAKNSIGTAYGTASPGLKVYTSLTSNSATSVASTTFTANWTSSAEANTYYLDVATDAGFTAFVSGYNNLNVGLVTTYPVTGLSVNTTYYYRVRAYNTANTLTSASSTSQTVLTAPVAPSLNSTTGIATTQFTARWFSVTGATSYKLDVATDIGFTSYVGSFNNLDVGAVLSYAITGLSSGTTYYYRVRSYNGASSDNSSTGSEITICSAPVVTAATAIAGVSFSANWNAATGAAKYYLDVAIDAGFTSMVSGFNNLDVGLVVTYSVTGLTAGTTYYYRVRAFNGASASASSNTIIVYQTPVSQASNVSYSSVTGSTFTVSWTNGGGSTRAVFIKAASSGSAAPVDGTTYSASTVFSSGTQIGGTGWYCIYNGTGTSVAVTGLSSGTTYRTMVCEYNGTAALEKYFITDGTVNPANQATLAAPSTQATTVLITSVSTNSFNVAWTSGNGDSRAVFIKATGAGTPSPVNNTTYTGNAAYLNGTQIDATGWYCLYNGAGTSVAVTNLSPGITYSVMVCEYNGTAGLETYNSNSATGNPAVQITVGTPTIQASAVSFSNVAPTTLTVSWTTGNGSNRAVFLYLGSSGTAAPVNNTTYSANTNFGNGTQIGVSGWYCVYNGTGASVAITGLTASTTYRAMVCEYNGSASAEVYNTTSNAANQTTTKAAPSLQAYGIVVTNVRSTSMTLTWTNNGVLNTDYDKVIVMCKANSAITIHPSNNVTYAASTVFGSGDAPTGGSAYTVYNGTGTTVNITGLTANTIYHFMVHQYNNTAGYEQYNNADGTSNNPSSQTMALTAPTVGIPTGQSTTSFIANWNTVTGTTSYMLDIGTTDGGTDISNNYNNGTSNFYEKTGLSPSTTYYYRVRAVNANGTSDNSSSQVAYTKCSAPVATSATNIGGASFSANWNTVTNATSYRLDVSTSISFSSFVSGYNDLNVLNVLTYSVTGLSANTPYYYRVRAVNASGASDNSNTITVTTLNEYIWTGATSTAWNLAANWDQNAIPTSSVSVNIPNVTNDPVIASYSATCNDLTIQTGGLLTISATSGTLTVSGNTTNNAGTILVDAGSGGLSGSLITTGSITNTGTVQMKVAMSKGSVSPFTRWHCVSSPVTNAVTATVFANSLANRYKYDETSSTTYWVAADASMSVGKGYYVAYNANKYQTFSSTGNFNNSDVSGISLSYSAGGKQGFHLIGNPYPCSLDWNYAWTLTNISTTIQIKNGDNWATFTQGGAGTNGGTRYIQPGQGFFVKASAATSITIPLAARVHNTGGSLLKSISSLSFIRFNLSDATLNSESIIMLDDNATTEFDSQIDAHKMFSDNINTPEVYCLTPVNHDTLVVDAVPYNVNLVKPIGVKIQNTGTYTLKANMISNIDPAIPLYLEDTQTGVYTDLRVDSLYTFTITSANYNVADRFNLRFSTNQVPPVIMNQSASSQNCTGETVAFDVTATGNPTYQWHGPQGLISGAITATYQILTVSETDGGTYYCVVTNNFGTVQSNNIVLTVKIPVTVSQHPASTTVCQGQNATLDVIASGTTVSYQWQKDGGDVLGQTASLLTLNNVSLIDAGNYTCVVTNACNSITTNASVFAVTANPVVSLGLDQSVCIGTTITLDAGNPGASYSWNDQSVNQTLNVTSTGTYSVVVTKDGCSSNDEVTVTVNSYPNVNLGNDVTVCAGTPVILDAGNSGAIYLWNDQTTSQTLNVTSTGTFNVAVTKDGCTANDEINVTVNTYPVVNLGNNQTVCEGIPVLLDAGNPGSTYIWSNGSTTQQLNVTTSDIYEVTVSNSGCSANDNVIVNFKPTPVVDLGSDISSCEGANILLDAGYITGNSYTWSNGSHNQLISPNTTGVYAVTVTNNGCSSSDNVSITITANPVVNLGNDQILCGNTGVLLDAGTASTYNWSTGETTQSVTVNQSGTYSVTVTDNACTGTDDVAITFKPAPVVDLGADASVCDGQAVTLDAGYVTGNTYTWSNGSHNQIISPAITGIYSVTVTNNGCTGTDEVSVAVNPNPTVNLGSDVVICSGCTETLDAGNLGATYLWSTGETTQTIDVTIAGTYTVTVTSADGCSDIDEIIVDVVSGIETNAIADKIELYPNPALNYVTISTSITGMYNIDIVDITGRIVLSIQTDKTQKELNISNLDKGVYLMRISNSKKQFVKTLIKQ